MEDIGGGLQNRTDWEVHTKREPQPPPRTPSPPPPAQLPPSRLVALAPVKVQPRPVAQSQIRPQPEAPPPRPPKTPPRPQLSPDRSRAPLLRAREFVASLSPTLPTTQAPIRNRQQATDGSDYGDEDLPMEFLDELDRVERSQTSRRSPEQTKKQPRKDPSYVAVDQPPPAWQASSIKAGTSTNGASQSRPRPRPLAASSRITPPRKMGAKTRPSPNKTPAEIIEISDDDTKQITTARVGKRKMDVESPTRPIRSRSQGQPSSPSKKRSGHPPGDDDDVIEISD